MRSNVPRYKSMIADFVDQRLDETGEDVTTSLVAEIFRQDLIRSGLMIESARSETDPEWKGVRVGVSAESERGANYPYLLNAGFIHHLTGELVGPYRFMENAWEEVEYHVKNNIWRRPIDRT